MHKCKPFCNSHNISLLYYKYEQAKYSLWFENQGQNKQGLHPEKEDTSTLLECPRKYHILNQISPLEHLVTRGLQYMQITKSKLLVFMAKYYECVVKIEVDTYKGDAYCHEHLFCFKMTEIQNNYGNDSHIVCYIINCY